MRMLSSINNGVNMGQLVHTHSCFCEHAVKHIFNFLNWFFTSGRLYFYCLELSLPRKIHT